MQGYIYNRSLKADISQQACKYFVEPQECIARQQFCRGNEHRETITCLLDSWRRPPQTIALLLRVCMFNGIRARRTDRQGMTSNGQLLFGAQTARFHSLARTALFQAPLFSCIYDLQRAIQYSTPYSYLLPRIFLHANIVSEVLRRLGI